MSQEYDPITTTTTVRKQRRTRQRRNRPVLVTETDTEIENVSPQTDEPAADPDIEQEAEATTIEPAPETKVRRVSRLPKFFTRVDKSDQEETTKEEDVVKARLARVTHDKASQNSKALPAKVDSKNDTKLQKKTADRREPLFKIRHFIGMTIYLFGAQFILPLEFSLARQLGIDRPFAQFTILDFPVYLSSALFLNIATLIVFLYILVKLDLLPNTTSARIRAEQKAKLQQGKGNGSSAVKNIPPPIRLGVKGEDDDLYMAYRANQRRERKR